MNRGYGVLLACFLLSFGNDIEAELTASRPNIVIIYSDDHSEQAISAYGSRINQTPHIDRLARDGVRFTNSFVCNSICGPSRATLLTGLHSHANGAVSNRARFRDELPTFAKSLQAVGYDTAMIGKWHLPSLPNGFDYWTIKRGTYYNPDFETSRGLESSTGHVTDVITHRSLDWIKNRVNPDQPFFLWISHSAVHRTWEPAIRHLNRYSEINVPEPTTLFDNYSGRNPGAITAQMRISRDLFPAYDLKLPVTGEGFLDHNAQNQLSRMNSEQRFAWKAAFGPRNQAFAESNLSGDALTRWNYQRYIKNYLRCVDGIDESVARVRDFMKAYQLDENTIVIYTSDQGFFLGEHGWYDKRWMYEPSLRTPLIIDWPGVTDPGATRDQLVQNMDLAPTILEMAGVTPSYKMHGRSLVPMLRGDSPKDWRDAIYYHYQMQEPAGRASHLVAKHYGIRTDRHKLIYFYEYDFWELYDLQKDYLEMENLYEQPGYEDLVGRLTDRLSVLRNTFEDRTGVSF